MGGAGAVRRRPRRFRERPALSRLDDLPRVEAASRAEWRAWLQAHHGQAGSVWMVRWKKGRGPHLPYDDAVEEALCFGWVDSLPRKLDVDRSMLLMSPRKAGGNWSAKNKERVARLSASGLMTPAGLAKVEAAKADGGWDALDAVERLETPDDLSASLAAVEGARAAWDAFPPSSRRGILEWIASARRPDTRARRVAETARLAGEGRMANHPAGRDRPRR